MFNRGLKSTTKYLFAFALFLIGLFAFSGDVHAGELIIHTVNVGQGDGIILESKGHFMIVDSGPTKSSAAFIRYLDKLNIPNNEIDYILATHPDEDHIGGFTSVLEKYTVKKAYYSACSKPTNSYNKFVNSLIYEGCTYQNPVEGQSWTLGDATVQVIYDGRWGSTYNECSIVLKVTCNNKSILLTADLPTTIEKILIKKKYNLGADILKVGHHGAAASTSESFLEAVNPKYAIISSGAYSIANTPKPSVLKRLASAFIKTYRTTDGNVVFTIKNGIISTKNREHNGYISISKGYIRLNKYTFYAPQKVGKEVSPAVSLYVNNALVSSSLYTVKYSANTHSGIATVRVTGNENPYIGTLTTTFKIKPRKPTIYSAYAEYSNIHVGWTIQTSCSGYELQYSTNKSFKKNVKTKTVKKGETTKTTITNLKSYKKYYIRVRAYTDGVGYGKWSKKVHVTSGLRLTPASVEKIKISKKSGKIKIKWAKLPNKHRLRYEVQYATDKKFKKDKVSVRKIKKKSYKTPKLAKGTYYVRVRSYNKYANGKWTKVKKIKI